MEVPVPKEEIKTPALTSMPIAEAFDFALKVKGKVLSERSLIDYTSKVKRFVKWLKEDKPEAVSYTHLTLPTIYSV